VRAYVFGFGLLLVNPPVGASLLQEEIELALDACHGMDAWSTVLQEYMEALCLVN
jgi:hypothetical protein